MAKISSKFVGTLLLTIILIVIIFTVIAETAPDVGAVAGNITCTDVTQAGCLNANDSTLTPVSDVLPLTSFFKKKGVILLTMIAGVVIVIIVAVLGIGKTK